ncbi:MULTISPECIES: hypothetical protein [Sphingomonas]|uniref:hypothetical protein n=1 Tax=Sphingomonas TaxID=13687 RepID=UPI0010002EE3|nr:hypothetical protein [Sphingomonas sp. ABOLF]RSV14630.1 hypothetical protein CA235_11160 [Sphingomonas sp. ABOLF]
MADRRIDKASERVSLYDASPSAYANEYYRGMDVDSYPVQTRIGRDREELAYYERRAPERIVELAEAEAHLSQVEDEVLLKVLAMRPTTGRVPWPRRLRPFESERRTTELAWAREDERLKARHARQIAALEAESERADEAFRASITKLVDSMAATIARMPKAKQETVRAAIGGQLARLSSGEIGAFEFLATITG